MEDRLFYVPVCQDDHPASSRAAARSAASAAPLCPLPLLCASIASRGGGREAKGITALSSLLKGGRAGLFWAPHICCSSKKVVEYKSEADVH